MPSSASISPVHIIADRKHVAQFIVRNKSQLIDAIAAGTHSGHPKPNRFADAPERFHERIGNWLDLLGRFFQGHEGMKALVAGQTSFEHTAPDRSPEENFAVATAAVATLRAELLGTAQALEPHIRAALEEGFEEALLSLTTPVQHYVDTLLIGDCLMVEVGGLAGERTMRSGVSFNGFPINARTPAQLAKLIERRPYKAIFFSPFSHARTSEMEALLRPSAALWNRGRIEAAAQDIIDQTLPLLDYLTANFECPIYVHNAGLATRTRRPLVARALALATARQRGIARALINGWLADYAASINRQAKNQIQIIDEVAIIRRLGGWPASLYLHDSEFQHATRLSFAIADDYAERIEMLAQLHGRKLLVCDLDNTLWDGIIGEGAVTHLPERQGILKRLKNNSGVVLSIASKNDPANVHFEGCDLAAEDFVAPQISWGLKRNALDTICTTLGLQKRHTAFIDDRADERSLVKAASPDIAVLDATDPRIWRQLAHWADLVEGISDLDRTALYREKTARDQFLAVHDGQADMEAHADIAVELDLKIHIRLAEPSDIKRAVELINRTNQWNMCGSRTTLAEIEELLASARGHLLIGRASDRFGDMGDICIALVRHEGEQAEIPIFVLSCRVFGYGVETAMLDEIVRCIDLGERTSQLVGHYVATAQNHMARNMYADYGFERLDDGRFILVSTVGKPLNKVSVSR